MRLGLVGLNNSVFRFVSIVATYVLFVNVTWEIFKSVFWATLLCHFILAMVYVGPRVKALKIDKKVVGLFFLLNCFWAFIYFNSLISLTSYFSVHFALAEAYIFRKQLVRIINSSMQPLLERVLWVRSGADRHPMFDPPTVG